MKGRDHPGHHEMTLHLSPFPVLFDMPGSMPYHDPENLAIRHPNGLPFVLNRWLVCVTTLASTLMACQYSIFTPQQPEANGKTQTPSVQVERYPHPFPDRDALFALAWQYADQMLHTGTARPLLHQLLTYQQATSQTVLQVTVFVPTLSTSINELNELSANHTMLCMRNHP